MIYSKKFLEILSKSFEIIKRYYEVDGQECLNHKIIDTTPSLDFELNLG